jgi:hypothetical protein
MSSTRKPENDYLKHQKHHGGSRPGRSMVRWDPWIKAFLQRWAVDHVAEGEEGRFSHGPGINKWAGSKFAPFLPVLEEIAPAFYERLKESCKASQKDMLNRVMNRHHKMFYERGSGRCRSTEHPEAVFLEGGSRAADIEKGWAAYGDWRRKQSLSGDANV